MPETTRMWVEVAFNVSYLVVIWVMVLVMALKLKPLAPQDRNLAKRVMWAFGLLALGDCGHVGLRVLAYARGGLEANPILVGAGAMATAFTVTLFYMLLVDIWRLRFNKKMGWFGWFLLAAGVVRMVVMLFPQNMWQQMTPPFGWSLLRNSFLVIQGLGVMGLILRDAARSNDRAFEWFGAMIAFSFLFYAPVILWVQRAPLLGMLMIPKTCAYLAMAFIAYRALFKQVNPGKITTDL